jgi:predicted Zn-dependent protease with MMP-like domain
MLPREDFEKLVRRAILDLPQGIRKRMDNVEIVIEDWPTAEQLQKNGIRQGVLLLGLYEGVPRTKRGIGYNLVLPDKITIFQKSIEEIAKTDAEIQEAVKNTVWHEIAHHFGFDEAGVRRMESRKKGNSQSNMLK